MSASPVKSTLETTIAAIAGVSASGAAAPLSLIIAPEMAISVGGGGASPSTPSADILIERAGVTPLCSRMARWPSSYISVGRSACPRRTTPPSWRR